ncbi:RIP metalloprotease RseP [Rickettsiales bacterium LUAb2]
MHILHFFFQYIVSFAALIIILVFIHELGHFLFARLAGVKVESFSIGFGKELFGFTDKKGTRWKIAPIPLGGYVKMKGEMVPTGQELDSDKDSFHNKSLLQKSLIVFAGPLFNLLLPIIIFFIIPLFFGVPTLKSQIKEVLPNTPAAKILQTKDIITKVNGTNISSFAELETIISNSPNQILKLVVLRNNNIINVQVKAAEKVIDNKKIGFIGVAADTSAVTYKKHGITESIKISFDLYKHTLFNILYGFKQLFTGHVKSGDIGGPIKIAELSGSMIKSGVSSWLFFLAALSINLAIVNLIPIPALDGGHLFLYLIQAITRKSIPYKLQNNLVMGGFALLLLLIVAITFHDVLGLFK